MNICHRPQHARSSPGPVNCNIRLKFQNQPMPKICERCRSGPCPFFRKDGTAWPSRRPTLDKMRKENEK
jgi:hypothetical protein